MNGLLHLLGPFESFFCRNQFRNPRAARKRKVAAMKIAPTFKRELPNIANRGIRNRTTTKKIARSFFMEMLMGGCSPKLARSPQSGHLSAERRFRKTES